MKELNLGFARNQRVTLLSHLHDKLGVSEKPYE